MRTGRRSFPWNGIDTASEKTPAGAGPKLLDSDQRLIRPDGHRRSWQAASSPRG